MKHIVEITYSGEGIEQSAQVFCSCGYKSPMLFAYSGHYWTNQHKYKIDHLDQVKKEAEHA